MPERSAVPVAQAAAITRAASLQSYLTIRWLADREYRDDAFALYAYFRWLDDTVDERLADRDARLGFVASQRRLLAATVATPPGAPVDLGRDIGPEEALLVRLARRCAATRTATPVGGAGGDAVVSGAGRVGGVGTQDVGARPEG